MHKAKEKSFNKVEEEIQQLKKQLCEVQLAGSFKQPIDLDKVESPFTKENLQLPSLHNSICHMLTITMGGESQQGIQKTTILGWSYIEQYAQLFAKALHSHLPGQPESGIGFQSLVSSPPYSTESSIRDSFQSCKVSEKTKIISLYY